MSFEPLGIRGGFYFHLQVRAEAWLLTAIYVLVAGAVLWRTRREWRDLSRAGWVLFAVLAMASALAARALLVRFEPPAVLTPPRLPEVVAGPAIPLLGGALILLAGARLGVGPALLVGLVSGLARAGWGSYRLTEAFEVALMSALAAALLRQRYHGNLMALLRRPLVAAPLSALVAWPLQAPGLLFQHPAPSLAALDYVWAFMAPALPAAMIEMLIAGAVVEIVYHMRPAWQPNIDRPLQPAPWQISLGRRMLYTVLPITLVAALAVLGAVTLLSYNASTDLVIVQMARDANSAAAAITTFIQTGSALIRDLAGSLARAEATDIEATLREGTRAVAFFSQILYYEPAGSAPPEAPAYQHPPDPGSLPAVTGDELDRVAQTLASDMPLDAAIFPLDPDRLIVSFIVPVQTAGGETTGALLGRTLLDANPIMQPAISSLRGVAGGRGEGFVVQGGAIILHPGDPGRVLEAFNIPANAARVAADANGAAYRVQARDGATELVYVQPARGSAAWSVVIVVPSVVVLEQAVQVAAPLLALLAGLGALALAWGYVQVTARITRPMGQLADAADAISQGDLDHAVPVAGRDEIGRLGASFERMRVNLKGRLDEQALLLQISQHVSAGLTLESTMTPILQGCLQVTGADGARLALSEGNGEPPAAFAAGPAAGDMAPLDRRLLELLQSEPRLVIERLARAQSVVNASALRRPLESLAALAVRQDEAVLGVLWLGFTKPHHFTDSELTFLSTLAGQAAVTLAKVQLFEEVRRERERLEIVLASTADAVLVADRHRRLVMVNPAAERPLQCEHTSLRGRRVEEALETLPALAALFQNPAAQPETARIVGHDGRTYEATSSPLMTPSGAMAGRVVVLHDITYYVELDAIKDDFVQTVSHDLRSPLTYMRGYATMLAMVGALNEKQQKFAEKIIVGVEQMSSLIENILDIGRLESGGELERDLCNMGELAESVVNANRTHALTKEITLTAEVAPDLPTVLGDEHLLRQAITNLVDNAIKYTPQAGHVNVSVRVENAHVLVAVRDDGPGISKADQAHLFEKFYRVRKREHMGVKGSGLGLAIVRGVARRHGGDAWVESKLGEGSTFYLKIPASDAPAT